MCNPRKIGEKFPSSGLLQVANFTRAQKGKIAETAVLLRLHLHCFDVYEAPDDKDKTDWLVRIPETGQVHRIEVRWVKMNPRGGLPRISLLCRGGVGKLRRYRDDEFDFVVGYDLYSDTAYIFSSHEVAHHANSIAICPAAAERWEKLKS